MPKKKRIGLALGGGAARGCAHLGVFQALEELGIEVDIVTGTSIGALLGAPYCAGTWKDLRTFLAEMSRTQMLSYWDIAFPIKGVMKGNKIEKALEEFLPVKSIKQLPIPFAAVAADVKTGKQVNLKSGEIIPAVRASISLPGVFSAVQKGSRHLVDGGLVEPVPVSLAREMGADIVIAVDLNYHLDDPEHLLSPLRESFKKWTGVEGPMTFDVLYRSVMMIQRELTIKSFQLDPPDIIIRPKVGHFKAFDFHRSEEMVEVGYKAAKKALKDL